VDADESLSVVMNEGQEIGFLLIVHFERAAGVEQDGVKIIQIFRGCTPASSLSAARYRYG
jgi:hypothetical protein